MATLLVSLAERFRRHLNDIGYASKRNLIDLAAVHQDPAATTTLEPAQRQKLGRLVSQAAKLAELRQEWPIIPLQPWHVKCRYDSATRQPPDAEAVAKSISAAAPSWRSSRPFAHFGPTKFYHLNPITDWHNTLDRLPWHYSPQHFARLVLLANEITLRFVRKGARIAWHLDISEQRYRLADLQLEELVSCLRATGCCHLLKMSLVTSGCHGRLLLPNGKEKSIVILGPPTVHSVLSKPPGKPKRRSHRVRPNYSTLIAQLYDICIEKRDPEDVFHQDRTIKRQRWELVKKPFAVTPPITDEDLEIWG